MGSEMCIRDRLKPACEADFLGYMDDKASNELIFFLVWPLPETAMGMLLRNRLVGALGALPCKHYVVRFIPLVRSEGSPHKRSNSTASPPVGATAKTKNEV